MPVQRRAAVSLSGALPPLFSGALALLLAVSLLGTLSVVQAAPGHAAGTRCVPPPVAHRGDSERAPENTLPAYRAAARGGVSRWEIDVRFTSDGRPVLMHDATVDRTTDGSGQVAELTLAQIRALDAGSWFAGRFAGVPVPTLGQVLRLAQRRDAMVLVELKTAPSPAQLDRVLDDLARHSMVDRVRVTSFDEQTILGVRANVPGLRTALIDNPRYRSPDSVLRYGQTYLLHHTSVTADRVRRWQRAGIEVRPWTVDSSRVWRRMAYDGAGPVITNRPRSYLAWARAFCS